MRSRWPPRPPARLYACGITPYDATHMGHAATYLAWDLLVRAWRDAGHEVAYVQNVTDVDDPLLERADRDGEDWRELAAREIALYRSDMTALRVLPPDHLIGAVEALPLIEEFNRVLASHGALYDLEGDTYFARSGGPGLRRGVRPRYRRPWPSYPPSAAVTRPGRARRTRWTPWSGWRPGPASRPGPPTSARAGRAGTSSARPSPPRYLGASFDVQAGGSDLIFPHHEMSASHARVALGGRATPVFARRYAHAGMVRLGGEKMSKSLGNLVFVSRLLRRRHRPDGHPAGHPGPPLPPGLGLDRRGAGHRPAAGPLAGRGTADP